MSNIDELRIRLKPDSPDAWTNPPTHHIGYYNYDIPLTDELKPKQPVQLDADKVLRYLEDICNIRLYLYQKEILRKFITARNEGKELIYRPMRQNGITTLRNFMIIINALYDD